MPDKVPYNYRHAHLFTSDLAKSPVANQPFTQADAPLALERYDKLFYGINNEELYAQNQSALSKLGNSAAKMAGTFTTSFLAGTVGLLNGIGEYASTGNFSSFFDNDFNRSIDNFNKRLEDQLPNYYSQAEKDAEWYSPTNIFSANFFGDKVLKNLGYSFGALAGGMGWGALFKGIGLTGRLIRAGQGLRTVEAVESAIANAPRTQQFGAINKTLNSLWQSTKNTAGIALSNSERAIISSTGMLGEATIEALQSTNEFRNKLIQDYKGLYGVNPTGQALEEINGYAESVGGTVFGANAVLLSLTNYIQLPKILGSSRIAEKRMINNIAKEGVDPTSKFVSLAPSTGNVLSPVANMLGKPGRFINKFVLGPGRLAFSAGEAFEEGAQFAIQTGTQDYFDRAAKNVGDVQETIDGIGGVLKSIFNEGVRKALTEKDGLESILIGGFSGALQKGVQNIKERGITGTGGVYGRNTQLALSALNKTNIDQVLKDGTRYAGIAFGSQKLRQQAIENNDVVNEKDYEKDFELAYILPRVKYGKLDSIIQEVEYYKEQASSDVGFQELMDSGVVLPGEKKEKFLARLNSVAETAKNVDKLHSTIDEKYSGVMVDEKPAYSPLVVDKLTYAAAKIADYDGRIPGVNNKLIAAGINNAPEIIEDATNDKSESFKTAVDTINANDKITETQKTDTIGLLEDIVEMGIRRDKFLKEYDEIIKTPEKFTDIDITLDKPVDEEGNPINSLKVKTRDGEKEFIIGAEYFAGSPIRKSKQGVDFKEFTKFTVLGTAENGEKIIIQTGDGKKLTIPVTAFEKYKIGDVSAVEKRPNAKFYMEAAGQIFTYQLGGGKKPIRGTVEYDLAKDQLKFVTLDGKRSYLVDRSRFTPKEGYEIAQIYSSGKLTKIAEEALKAPITPEELAALYNQRDAIINEVVNNNKKRLEEVNKNLEISRKELASINEAIDNVTLTKKGLPKKRIDKAVRKTINQLADTKQRLESNITNLEFEREDLEDTLLYFNDILQYKDELPQEYSEIIKDLRGDVDTLEDLIDNTNVAIKDSKSTLSGVEEALKKAFSLLDDFAKRLAEENPDIPLSVDALRDRIEKYLGEEGAKQFIDEKLGFTEAVMDLEDQMSLFADELNIPDLTKQAEDLRKDINELEAQLDELVDNQANKAKLMEAFELAADQYKQRLEEEAIAQNNPKLVASLLNTAYKGVQTEEFGTEFEPDPKKSTEIIPRATMGIDRGKVHQTRANTFGYNLNKFENRKDIRGVYVTSKNEDQLIPGLTDRLRQNDEGVIDENIKKDEIIALVMVIEDEEGNIIPVGVDGKPIPVEQPLLDSAIYQVFPSDSLSWSGDFGGKSMFRKNTPDEIKEAITEQYKKWRASVIKNPDITQTHEIEASFGRPQVVRDAEGKPVMNTRTSVQDAGLVSSDDLEGGSLLIKIPTLAVDGNMAVESEGTVSFRVPVGTVLLSVPNGLVKLKNKQHSRKEAETIFEAILQLSKYSIAKVDMKDPEPARLIQWLQSTVYWGIPLDQDKVRKPTGYNSIFFEKDKETGKIMLTISNKGEDVPFSPLALKDNKEIVINLITQLYNNVNNSMAKKLNEPYEEILSVSENGEVTSRIWNNYQSYLLSNTTPDGKKRSGEELPLSTIVRPLVNAEDVNRSDIYFFTTDTADDFVIPVVEKKKTVISKTLTPGAPKKAAPVSDIEAKKADIERRRQEELNKAFDNNKNALKDQIDKAIKDKGWKTDNVLFHGGPKFDKFDKQFFQTGEYSNVDMRRVAESMGVRIPEGNFSFSATPITSLTYALRYGKNNPTLYIVNKTESLNAKELTGNEEKDAQEWIINGDDIFDTISVPLIPNADKINAKYDAELDALEEAKPVAKEDEDAFVIGEEEEEAPTGYVLDGETKNKYTSPKGKTIYFKATLSAGPNNLSAIQVLPGGDFEEVRDALKNAGKDAKYEIKMTLYKAIEPTLLKQRQDDSGDAFSIPDETVEEASDVVGDDISLDIIDDINNDINGLDDEALRVAIDKELAAFVPENWDRVETWLKANFPNVPVYRVKNIIQATNGRQAWGMFKDGAIYIYENAEVGTVYHEVFHGVWRMFTDSQEQKAILDEMRARGGKFFDRESSKDIKYSEATEKQLEEKLAEEFRDYVQEKKIPAKPTTGRPYILKLFADMVTAIKEFFFGPESDSKVTQMFSRIGEGYYKSYIPYQTNLAFAKKGVIDIDDAFADSDDVLSLVNINDRQRSDIIQHMTYLTLADLIKTDESLFEMEKRNKSEIYKKLRYQIFKTIANKVRVAQKRVVDGTYTQKQINQVTVPLISLMQNIRNQWDTIVEKHEEYLKGYQIEFDEDENIMMNSEDKSGKETWQDATRIDNFKKANAAIKLLLATIPEVDSQGKMIRSEIGGAKLLPVGRTYISLMNNLHTSSSIEEMVERLREMAENDPNYRTLYKRITKQDWKKKGVDLSNIKTTHGLQLISSLWRTFKKQSPDVKNVFILDNGDVVVGEANLASAAQQLRNQYINSIVLKAKSGKGFFKYRDKVFKGDPSSITGETLEDYPSMIKFLDKMGIPFTTSDISKMNKEQRDVFKEAVRGIRTSISKGEEIATFSGKALKIHGRLLQLGLVKAAATNPEFSSTYFNVAGERIQTFIGTNAASDLYDFVSKLEKFNENTVGGSRYSYLLTDSFAKGSNILSRMFTSAGTRKPESKDLLKVGYVGGINNSVNGKKKESSRLTYPERLIQELNLNLEGIYLNLVPGDASIEHTIRMGNPISTASLGVGFTAVNDIFKEYFLSELELVREDRPVAKGRDNKEMRFFRGILGDKLHSDVLKAKGDPLAVYNRFEDKINTKVAEFITKDAKKLTDVLKRYGLVEQKEGRITLNNINLPSLTQTQFEKQMLAFSVNYMIANIEMHKLLYSDPYQYEDELKRIKSFLSPRQSIISNSPKMNAVMNNIWNEDYEAGDIGNTKFGQDYFRSATHADVIGVIDLPNYDAFKETDGGGIMTMKANRHFRIRAGEWNSDEERQYRYDVAWEKNDKGESLSEEDKKKRGLVLSQAELDIIAAGNPDIQSAYTPIKPIVAGSRLDENGNPNTYNDVVLDKFSLYPLSYRIIKEVNKSANALNLYNKMQREDIDYIVFSSSRKVGGRNAHPTYNEEDGSFNDNPYKGVVNIPFSIMSIQSEVPSKDEPLVTRGSQITKLVTLDFLEAGVPVDYVLKDKNGKEITDFDKRYAAWYKLDEDQQFASSNLFREIKNNQKLLEKLIEDGYNKTLSALGLKETIIKDSDGNVIEKKYEVEDLSKAAETLRKEILKREVNDNMSSALIAYLNGSATLEATAAYQQVRNILYSIADKDFISPKISGGMKVQIPSTFWETNRLGIQEINGKKGYTSDVLKFYEKGGERIAEVMIGRWFDSPLSDEELLKYLNTTDEGQKILSGVAYRIPTQKQNSIDRIIIKKFLPKEFGDSVVIPAAMVAKVGSDFDIDKLSMYLKNVYRDAKGNVKLVPFYGYGQQAKDKFEDLFAEIAEEKIDIVKEKIESLYRLQQLLGDILTGKATEKVSEKWTSILRNMFGQTEASAVEVEEAIMKRLEKKGKQLKDLNNFTLQEILMEEFKDRMYTKSLENAYIESMENLIGDRSNYNNLIKPNSAEPLKELSRFIAEKTVGQTFDYKNVDNMLDRTFMSRLRHAFVTGKYAIGIAAVNQTNHSLNQRQPIYIDSERLDRVSADDKYWLGSADIKFQEYNTIEVDGKKVPTLSMIKNKAGETITDIIGMFIDGYVDISKGPWIMELGATPNVASTWLFLVKLGVPIKTVAYFMNQPIIRDYLRTIESAGYSWLFIDQFVKDMSDIYEQDMPEVELKKRLATFKIPSETALRSLVGKRPSELNAQQKMDQFLMLKEFLKYAKMAEHLFLVTQGSNYDTATINDGFLVFKKQMQQVKAQNTIISSVDSLLSNSFIGPLASQITDVRNAFAKILKAESPKVRNIIQNTLTPFINLNDRDFVKLSQKAVNDLFDWAVQTDQNFNKMIKDILIKKGGAAIDVLNFVNSVKEKGDRHPLSKNEVINMIQVDPSKKAEEGGVNNLRLSLGDNKVYDQNNIIYAFRELRDYLKGENSSLYDQIVNVAILQSGLSQSSISFTSLIPFEDFEKIYSQTLNKLESIENLDDFYKLGVFQRNNWNNDDVVPYVKAAWIDTKNGPEYNPSMKYLPNTVKNAVQKNIIPTVVTRSPRNRDSVSDYIVYTWEDMISSSEKEKMRKAGDFSYINKGLFKKVYRRPGEPYVHVTKTGNQYFVYKAINAWGDGFRANEFWKTDHKSVINNGFVQVEDVADDVVIDAFDDKLKMSVKTAAPSTPVTKGTFSSSASKINIYAGTGENAELSNFAKRPFSPIINGVKMSKFNTVEGAFQASKILFYSNLREQQKEDYKKLKESTGAQAKALGGKVKGLNVKEWDTNSSRIMKDLLKQSFEQNPEALKKLLATGNAELTHTQDTTKWGKEFPKLLMEVRKELSQQIKPKGLPAINNKNQKSCG